MTGDAPARHAAFATGAMFLVNGATFSNWLPRIPEVRDALGIGNTGLGATLLGGGAGGLVASLIVGRTMDRVGSRRQLIWAATALSVLMPLIAVIPVAALLLVLLFALGVLDVLADVAMNAQGVIAQQLLGKPIMNRLHAMWSLGFTGGAVLGSAAAAAGLSLRVHLALVGVALLATVTVSRRWLIRWDPPHAVEPSPSPGTRRRRVTAVTVAVALAAVGATAVEQLPNDWSAVLLRDVFHAGRTAGAATVAFAGAMLVGRLAGDHVVARFGTRSTLYGALTVVLVGVIVTVAAPVAAVAYTGLAVWGLGLSVVYPQLYTTAARLPGTSAGAGMGAMMFGQRTGSMVMSITTGAIAGWADVRVAFLTVAAIAFVLLALSLPRTT